MSYALQIRRVLGISALAPEEFQIGWSNSTNFFQSLWDDLDEAGRALVVRFLQKAHIRIGRRILKALTEDELNHVNIYVNRVLGREAILAANNPEFMAHASNLKGIIVEAIGIRINVGVAQIDEKDQDFIAKFMEALKRLDF